MEIQENRKEITVRLLQNGRYVWTITANAPLPDKDTIELLKQMDGELRDKFPNHVKENSIKFQGISDEE